MKSVGFAALILTASLLAWGSLSSSAQEQANTAAPKPATRRAPAPETVVGPTDVRASASRVRQTPTETSFRKAIIATSFRAVRRRIFSEITSRPYLQFCTYRHHDRAVCHRAERPPRAML